MEEIAFQNIEYTPAWYYTNFPGFYNVECYNILADYSQHPEKYMKEQDEGVEETKINEDSSNVCTSAESNDDEADEHVNKKCKISKEEAPV